MRQFYGQKMRDTVKEFFTVTFEGKDSRGGIIDLSGEKPRSSTTGN